MDAIDAPAEEDDDCFELQNIMKEPNMVVCILIIKFITLRQLLAPEKVAQKYRFLSKLQISWISQAISHNFFVVGTARSS